MTTVNIHEAKTQFSKLVDQAASGEEIIIAKSGRPVARLMPLAAVSRSKRRLGLGAGKVRVPADFDQMLSTEIAELFGVQRKP
jgi:prevent-host-death family protein